MLYMDWLFDSWKYRKVGILSDWSFAWIGRDHPSYTFRRLFRCFLFLTSRRLLSFLRARSPHSLPRKIEIFSNVFLELSCMQRTKIFNNFWQGNKIDGIAPPAHPQHTNSTLPHASKPAMMKRSGNRLGTGITVRMTSNYFSCGYW